MDARAMCCSVFLRACAPCNRYATSMRATRARRLAILPAEISTPRLRPECTPRALTATSLDCMER
eukprot:5345935-Pyramimonas_sp.AAC.1